MSTESFRPKPDADPQQRFDESIQEFNVSNVGEDTTHSSTSFLNEDYDHERFLRDYKRYSAHFHDNDNGPPGVDNDFGTQSGGQQGWKGTKHFVRPDDRNEGVREREEESRLLEESSPSKSVGSSEEASGERRSSDTTHVLPHSMTGFEHPDTRMATEAMTALANDPVLNADDVEVEVEGAIATLVGTVPEVEMLRLAENAVESIPGIMEVRDELQVIETRHTGLLTKPKYPSDSSEEKSQSY